MRRAPELAVAAAVVATIGGGYLALGSPAALEPGRPLGHLLGVVGFALMLATETLYSIRKRVRGRAWGPMRTWLRAHIVTGIVGPFLVLLHTRARLDGLAGWTTAAVVAVVVSGFVGRYLYTALPRDVEGEELEGGGGRPTGPALVRLRRLLAVWHTVHVPLGMAMFTLAFIHIGAAIYFAAGLR